MAVCEHIDFRGKTAVSCAEHRTGVRCLCMRAPLGERLCCLCVRCLLRVLVSLFAFGAALRAPQLPGILRMLPSRCATSPVRLHCGSGGFHSHRRCSGECCRLRTHKHSCADRAIEPHRSAGAQRLLRHRTDHVCLHSSPKRMPWHTNGNGTTASVVRWYQWQQKNVKIYYTCYLVDGAEILQ